MLHLVADAPPPTWLRIDVSSTTLYNRLCPCLLTNERTYLMQSPQMIEKVVVLLVPGITSDLLSLPPVPTSAMANPNLPLAIPLLSHHVMEAGAASQDEPLAVHIPFIASTFSHACPTRAPGDQTRMHSVLSAFFQGPVSGEERRRRVVQRLTCMSASFLILSFVHTKTSLCSRGIDEQGPRATCAFGRPND